MLEISGKDAILAYVVGQETTRIARGVHMHITMGVAPDRNTWRTMATATASRLLGLSIEQTAKAPGIAASLASASNLILDP